MNKSVFDRFFPRPSRATLPQYEEDNRTAQHKYSYPIHSSPPAIALRDSPRHSSSPSIPASSVSPQQSQHAPPLSASLLHHDDPFLPIDRAAKALQETIQMLLDAQSVSLGGRMSLKMDDEHSNGSLTPTPSATADAWSTTRPRTVPIRQPSRKKVTLREARKRLARSMQEFASLREEELALLDSESAVRVKALDRVKVLGDQKDALTAQIASIKHEESNSAAQNLRTDAHTVQGEIQELEHRLLELKVKHRHLLSQADEIENTFESRKSSYSNTLSMVEREVKTFLRRPPVQQPFASMPDQGLYALKADRRTLEMAKDQWTTELGAITTRSQEVEAEHLALVEGEAMWSQAVRNIHSFELRLRSQTSRLSPSMIQSSGQTDSDFEETVTAQTCRDLDTLIQSLEHYLEQAQGQNWNLLVCALGAELQACVDAREMLEPGRDDPSRTEDLHQQGAGAEHKTPSGLDQGGTKESPSLLPALGSPAGSNHSNQSNHSLRDTLLEFEKGDVGVRPYAGGSPAHTTLPLRPPYESEDDEPPADFLLSR